eukprot:m.295070 g.295070  ORF g.295070 m.295070 type:complete len:772 (+) comp16393_c3_seq2:55-2370(+)
MSRQRLFTGEYGFTGRTRLYTGEYGFHTGDRKSFGEDVIPHDLLMGFAELEDEEKLKDDDMETMAPLRRARLASIVDTLMPAIHEHAETILNDRIQEYEETPTLEGFEEIKAAETTPIEYETELKNVGLHDWEKSLPDVYAVYCGEMPKSWRTVAQNLAKMLRAVSKLSLNVVENWMQPKISHIFAHCDCFTSGVVSGDIGVDDWGSILHKACSIELATLASQLHKEAVPKAMQDVLLNIPYEYRHVSVNQEMIVPYLQEPFFESVLTEENSIFLQKKYSNLKFRDVSLLMLAIQSQFIEYRMKKSIFNATAQEFGRLGNTDPKSFVRMRMKTDTDYLLDANPVACLCNTVRRCAIFPSVLAQQSFLEALSKDPCWVSLRLRNSQSDPTASVKCCKAHFIYKPASQGDYSGFDNSQPDRDETFGAMLSSPRFQSVAKAFKAVNNIQDDLYDAALKLLSHKLLQQKPIQIIVEIQLYLEPFYEKSRLANLWLRVCRAPNARVLTQDFAIYASSFSDQNIENDFLEDRGDTLRESLHWLRKHDVTSMLDWDLSEKELGPHEGLLLSRIVQQHKKLNSLNLGHNHIGDHVAATLIEVVRGHPNLLSLSLAKNQLHDTTCVALGSCLLFSTTLTALNLEENNIGVNGAKTLSKALTTSENLLSLNLNKNKLGSDGAELISEALRANTSLKELRISHNGLHSKGGVALAGSLTVNSHLAILESTHNGFDSFVGFAFAEALEDNTTLESLRFLTGNQIGEEALEALKQESFGRVVVA